MAEKWRDEESSPAKIPHVESRPRIAAVVPAVAPGASEDRSLAWCGAFVCVVLTLALLAVIASSNGWFDAATPVAALAAPALKISPQRLDRIDCAEIGDSDLQSAPEGVWFQANCLSSSESAPAAEDVIACNRTSLDPAEFTSIGPGLFVYRQTPSSRAFLWYASSEACFNLVSSRVVTAVCHDLTVSFDWKAGACSGNGGVLARVNGSGR